MTLTTHAAIGAAIGSVTGNPLLGFFLGAASHFLVDMIPHGDNQLGDLFRLHKKRRLAVAYVTVDAVIALFLILTVFSTLGNTVPNFALAAAIGGSILPDLLVGLSDIYRVKPLRMFCKFHFFFHDFFSRKHGDVKLKHSLIAQAFVIAILFKVM